MYKGKAINYLVLRGMCPMSMTRWWACHGMHLHASLDFCYQCCLHLWLWRTQSAMLWKLGGSSITNDRNGWHVPNMCLSCAMFPRCPALGAASQLWRLETMMIRQQPTVVPLVHLLEGMESHCRPATHRCVAVFELLWDDSNDQDWRDDQKLTGAAFPSKASNENVPLNNTCIIIDLYNSNQHWQAMHHKHQSWAFVMFWISIEKLGEQRK